MTVTLNRSAASYEVAAREVKDQINVERDRRIVAGKTFTLEENFEVAVTGREEDFRNLTNLALAAQLQIAQGNGSATTVFRDDTDTIVTLTYDQMLELWALASTYVTDVYAASWTLKDTSPIPGDFLDDSHWP